jgi:hypothetical protein
MPDIVYHRLWKVLNEGFQTAPSDANGNPHPSFLKHLELCYTTEEAALLQHMDPPVRFVSTQDLADRSGKPLDHVEALMASINKKTVSWGGLHRLRPLHGT